MSTNVTNDSSRHHDWILCGHFDVSYPVKISKLIFLSIILLSSLVGNALIVTMVYTRQELRKAINFFIVNMAISDFFFTLVSIPFYLAKIPARSYLQWPVTGKAGLILCKLSVFFPSVSFTVSVQSLVWIALDRFVAVVFPMNNYFISSRFHAFAIASTWMVAIIINFTDLYTTSFVKNGDAFYCLPDLQETIIYTHIALTCIVPMLIMTILYCAIAATLRRQNKSLRCAAVHKSHQRKRQAIKMSICIIVTFYVLVLPFTIIIPVIFLSGKIALSCYESLFFFAISGLYISSTTNPIICFTFVGSYRRGVRELFSSCWLYKKKARSMLKRGEAEEIYLQRIKSEY